MACLNDTVTVSWLTGVDQLVSTSGLPLIEPKFPFGALAVVALACSACGSENAPLTSLPALLVLGSATERAASPAVEMTLAVVEAMYSPATPGTKDPSWAALPRPSESVAGTVPPGELCGGAAQPPQAIESSPLTDAPLLVILPVAVSIVTTFEVVPKSPSSAPHSQPLRSKARPSP